MFNFNKTERFIEKGLFVSRWIMAPFYIGLVGALMVLLYTFGKELLHFALKAPNLGEVDVIIGILALIDMSLAGNLLIIVILAGYENFVSKIEVDGHQDIPDWKNEMDFSALKLKLVSSIIAISGVHMLKIFVDVKNIPESQIKWMVIIHIVLVVSGVLLALMDKISDSIKTEKKKRKNM